MRPTHARGKQSGRSLVEAKADCVTERVKRAKFRMLLNKGNISCDHSERIQFVYCVECTVALHCRSFASRLASPASECRSADQRGKLWAQGS